MSLNWYVSRCGPLRGRMRVPGDKSISHRCVMLGALAEGTTQVAGFLEAEDTLATLHAFQNLGVRVEHCAPGQYAIHGVGLHGLSPPAGPLDLGNSGTGMRLLAGVLAGQQFASVLLGDDSLSRRPMRRVVEPLSQMGAHIRAREGQFAPLCIDPSDGLRAIRYAVPVASAQVKSSILLAALYATGTTEVLEPHPTRDYTERMLQAFGCNIEVGAGVVRLHSGASLRARAVSVPGDFSSAAFFLVAASVVPGSDLHIEAVGVHPRRTGLLHVLRQMGADIQLLDPRTEGGEPVADLRVRHAPLRGVTVSASQVADMIDEFPALFAAAAAARGCTRIEGAGELRFKESDRIAAMARALRALGGTVEEQPQGAEIEGGVLHGGSVDSLGDHRIAMASAVAACLSDGEVEIRNCANVATSFPGFTELAQRVGLQIRTTHGA